MAQATITTPIAACGCKVTVTFPRVDDAGMVCLASEGFMSVTVEMCAVHKAAPKMHAALNKLACWDEGEVVHGGFDDPATAQFARDVLAKIK